jgi:hypothetical protein
LRSKDISVHIEGRPSRERQGSARDFNMIVTITSRRPSNRMGMIAAFPSRVALALACLCGVLSAQVPVSTKPTPARSALLVHTLYLWRGGCQPQTVNAKAGTFVLSVVNLSGENNLQLVLHPASTVASATSAIGAQALTTGSTRWNSTVTLSAGTYLVEATNSSTHHCSIVVQYPEFSFAPRRIVAASNWPLPFQ